ncbi:MAG TPA: ABC transporter ATP-binding protein [Thermoplasmata archaeon]|nr:ABC transporter ATP-binding protein [Thermoplasmata archaeon]
MPLLEIRNLRTYYHVRKGEVKAVDGVDFTADRSKTVGLVGESGCGKTTMAFAILQILPSNARTVTGEVRVGGELVFRAPLPRELKFLLEQDGSLETVRDIIASRAASLDADKASMAAAELMPILEKEGSLVEDAQELIANGTADPAVLRRDLLDLVERRERAWNRGFTRRAIQRSQRNRMQALRWSQVSMIFQGAMNAFNPVYRVGDQIEEALEVHMEMTPEQRDARIQELFRLVGMTPDRAEGYPHEFSGGMKQRAMIAMALACKPDLIIADEPTTALDVIMQDRILGEIRDLQRELNLAMMIITHDISVVAEVSDRIVIMYAGEVVEEGSTESVFERPSHPYAIGLLEAFPSVKGPKKKLRAIPGSPPDLVNPPSGCRFHPRCRFAQDICTRERPELIEVDAGHRSRCHFAKEIFGGSLA